MPANVESMFYTGEVPWHGLGTSLDHVATAEEAITAAGLDWEVQTRPVHFKEQWRPGVVQEHLIDGKIAIVRATDQQCLAVMSDRYKPLQNREAFGFFDNIVETGEAIYHTAGSLDGGRKIWILAQVPGHVEPLPGDVMEKYILLANSHDGSLAVTIKFTQVRVVCNNTLMQGLNDGNRSYTFWHEGDYSRKFAETAKVMGLAKQYYDVADEAMKYLAGIQVDAKATEDYTKKLLPTPKSIEDTALSGEEKQELLDNILGKRRTFMDLVESGKGTEIPGVRGTAYGLYMAATEYQDYFSTRWRTNNNRVNAMWFGDVAQAKEQAYKLAVAMGKN